MTELTLLRSQRTLNWVNYSTSLYQANLDNNVLGFFLRFIGNYHLVKQMLECYVAWLTLKFV